MTPEAPKEGLQDDEAEVDPLQGLIRNPPLEYGPKRAPTRWQPVSSGTREGTQLVFQALKLCAPLHHPLASPGLTGNSSAWSNGNSGEACASHRLCSNPAGVHRQANLWGCMDELIYDLFRMRSGTFCNCRLKRPFIKAEVGV